MKITKLGHCCMIVEDSGLRVMTDPGAYSSLENEVKNIDVVLITHEHQDHFHLESLKKVLANNPEAKIFTNGAVGKLLDAEKITYEILEDGARKMIAGTAIEGFGKTHAPIYPSVTPVQNTGYFVADRFFYPGDAFYDPKKPVEILALPMAGPWLKISESIDYAKSLKPKVCFPVHDGMLNSHGLALIDRLPAGLLKHFKVGFKTLKLGEAEEL